MRWYARYGLVALVFAAVVWICACEKPQHVARCVERCEKMPAGCFFNDTVLVNGVRWCRCNVQLADGH